MNINQFDFKGKLTKEEWYQFAGILKDRDALSIKVQDLQRENEKLKRESLSQSNHNKEIIDVILKMLEPEKFTIYDLYELFNLMVTYDY